MISINLRNNKIKNNNERKEEEEKKTKCSAGCQNQVKINID